MARCRRLFVNILIAGWALPAHADWLHHGDCSVKEDPALTPLSLVNVCVKAKAGSWIMQKSKTKDQKQPDVRHHAEGDLSFFVTPWISMHVSGHTDVFISRETNETTVRDTKRDSLIFQIGNNALSRHRVHGGRGRPVFRIDHQVRKELGYAWDLQSFEAPLVDFASYVYDNQLDWTVEGSYGQLTDDQLNRDQRIFAAARLMYDIAALEGTRITVGGFSDGLSRRTVSLGILNINGKGDETALEVSRSFLNHPYNPAEFNQIIRLSYLSHEQSKTKYKFQYDDFFKQIRVGSFGAVYAFHNYADIEAHIGYAKHEDTPKLSHGFIALNVGAHL